MRKPVILATIALAALFGVSSTIPAQAQSAKGVQIIYIQQYFDRFDYPQIPMTYRNPSRETRAKAQDEIRNNPTVRNLLEQRNIRFERVNAVKTALNGGKVVYVD